MKNIEDIKLPPSDTDAEENLLAEVMNGGWEAFDEAEKIIQDEDAFYSAECRHLWKALKKLRRNEEEYHIVTIKDEAKKNLKKYLEIAKNPKDASIIQSYIN